MEPSPDVLRGIRAIALDIDGVITDGGLIPLSDGDLLRVFDAKERTGPWPMNRPFT